MHHHPYVYDRKKNFLKISSKLMEDLSDSIKKYLPKIRDQKKGETTPEYLNHINAKVNKAHNELIQLSPFYKISKILETPEPLSLKEIKEIFNEVKRHRSA
jgi:hypothetical protein